VSLFTLLPASPSNVEAHAAHQTANGLITSYDALLELLESIEHLLKPLDIYTQITTTPAMDELVVDIMVELLSTLALTTNELKQGRSSKFVLSEISPRLIATQRDS